MFLRKMFLGLIGLSAGGVIAAGVFAFLAIIGVFPRLLAVTKSGNHILCCETMLILGGILGNLITLDVPVPMAGGFVMLILWGFFMGLFVGCLVMSLAETLKAIPVLSRRIRLATGIQYMITAVAAGKLFGSLLYFWKGFGGK